MDYSLQIGARVDGALNGIRKLEAGLKRLQASAEKINKALTFRQAELKINTKGAERAIGTIERRIQNLTKEVKVVVKPDVQQARTRRVETQVQAQAAQPSAQTNLGSAAAVGLASSTGSSELKKQVALTNELLSKNGTLGKAEAELNSLKLQQVEAQNRVNGALRSQEILQNAVKKASSENRNSEQYAQLKDRVAFNKELLDGFKDQNLELKGQLKTQQLIVQNERQRANLTKKPTGFSRDVATGVEEGAIAGALKLAGAYIGVDQAVRGAGAAFQATFNREGAEQRLKALTGPLGEYEAALEIASASAKKFGISQTEALTQVGDAYGRLRPLGVNLGEIRDIQEGFATATRLSGTSAAEAAGSYRQLLQALGAGALRGEELNSVLDQAPAVAKALGDQLKVPVGQLKELAKEGKITSDVVVAALRAIRQDGGEQLAASLETPAAKLQILTARVEDLQVAWGKLTLPAVIRGMELLAKAAGLAADGIGLMTKTAKELKPALDAVLTPTNFLVKLTADLFSNITKITGAAPNMGVALREAFTNAVLGAIPFARELNNVRQLMNFDRTLGDAATGGSSEVERATFRFNESTRVARPSNINTVGGDSRSLTERLGVPAGDDKKVEEAVKRGVIGGITGGRAGHPMAGNARGEHLHGDMGGTQQQLLSAVDKALEFPGGRTASSYGLGRGAGEHGYNGRDYLIPAGTPFRLRPGYTGKWMGNLSGYGGTMDVRGPGITDRLRLGHLNGPTMGNTPDAWDSASDAAAEAERQREEALRRRMTQLDQEETRVKALAQIKTSNATSELEKLGIEKKLENDLLFIATKRAELEPDPNVKLQSQARQAEIAAQERDVLKQIADLSKPVDAVGKQVMDLFKTDTDSPLKVETDAIRQGFSDLNDEIDDLLLQLDKLGSTPASEVLKQKLTGLKGDVASGAEAAPTIATQKLISPIQQELQGRSSEQQAQLAALKAGRTELSEQERTMLQLKQLGVDLTSQAAVRALAEAGVVDQQQKQIDEATRQLELYRSIGDAIETGIGSAIIGLVEGTQTLNEALSQTLKQIGQILIQSALSNAFGYAGKQGGILGALFGGPRAKGGPVDSGKSYLVGEDGPEFFIPGVSGQVIPNSESISVAQDLLDGEEAGDPSDATYAAKQALAGSMRGLAGGDGEDGVTGAAKAALMRSMETMNSSNQIATLERMAMVAASSGNYDALEVKAVDINGLNVVTMEQATVLAKQASKNAEASMLKRMRNSVSLPGIR